MMNNDRAMLKVSDVAKWLQISERSVWREVARGNLGRPLKLGGCTRFQACSVEAYIKKLEREQK